MKMAPSLHPNIINFLMDALEREKERAREVIVIENKTATIAAEENMYNG
jgi:hypothetical protein